MRIYLLQTEQWFARPVDEVFEFFSDARNLDRITPPWLHFRILTPMPVTMARGVLLDYRIRWRGLPLSWRTEIVEWEPPHRFIDMQIRGPYRRWHHTHSFEPHAGGTLMRDRVEYAVPGGPLAPWIARWLVSPDVERIFTYRRNVMEQLLSREAAMT